MNQPPRILGLFSATCIVVGAIIGVGIFFTPAKVVALTGDGTLALAAWIIAGLIALCGALVFGELGRKYHASGAQYQILRDAYGPCPAFLFVFCNATAIQVAAVGIIAFICASNLLALGGADPTRYQTQTLILSCLLIAGVIVANWVGVRWGSTIQNLTVVCKVATLIVLAILAVVWGAQDVTAATTAPLGPGWATADPEAARAARLSPWAAVMAALVPAFFSYGGWQHALWISGEVKSPTRNLPRAIVGGMTLVVAIYVLTAWSTLRLLGVEAVGRSTALASDAVAVVQPDWGRSIIAAAVAVSAFGVLNAQLLSGPRLVFGMAQDKRFFTAFARLSRFGTPTAAILLIGLMALALLLVSGEKGVDKILTGAVFIDGVFFALTGAALFILRNRPAPAEAEPDAESAHSADAAATVPAAAATPARRTPVWMLVIAALFILGELGVVVGSYLDPSVQAAALVGAAWIGVAAVVYAIWFRGGST